ncbi:hypothetical protein AQZ52_00580 [Novosphingobium fuchskuhlense]|uniref:Uncharacterized protein n=1 Tax=Novosphingobium fuchskuhlense TaxID=1117702 RepID=A0A117UZ69_9SPHN|nr:hypothetical protein AQZ52_00580 [Novosphingobium fuchskuhlense]
MLAGVRILDWSGAMFRSRAPDRSKRCAHVVSATMACARVRWTCKIRKIGMVPLWMSVAILS